MTEADSESEDGRTVSRCTVCSHPRRQEIEQWAGASRTERAIALEFGLSKASINRHKRHSRTILHGVAARKAEIESRLGKTKDDRDYAVLSRELRALEEHERRIEQENAGEKALADYPGFQAFLTHLLATVGECERCREAILQATTPRDTRSE